LQASDLEGIDSIPSRSMCGVWSIMWYWTGFCPSTLALPCHY